MSLRIYIKGTPKFSSPKKIDSSSALSSHFNAFPSKMTHYSKKSSLMHAESREASIMSEISPIRRDNPLRSLDENHIKARTLSQADSNKGYENSRFTGTSYHEEESHRKLPKNTAQNAQTNTKMQKVIKDLQRKLSMRENIPDRQLRIILKDCDEIIRYFIQELEKSNKLIRVKESQNTILQKEKDTLETEMQHIETEVFNKLNQELESKYVRELELKTENDAELLQGNERLEKEVKSLMDLNQELLEEISLLKEMSKKSENTLQKERECFLSLKENVEALMTLNDELDYKLKEKEDVIKKLENELREAISNNVKLIKEMPDKNLLNSIISPLAGGNNNTLVWSTFRMDTPRELLIDKENEEANEWKKKYEASKNDNLRLIKIIEGNQKVIKDLKDSFSELETRNNVRFDSKSY